MYVDSKPVSLYSRHSTVEMENPKPQLRRPPAVLNHSSSSLTGLERSIPSFQSFVKRTPTPNSDKPLPPVPSFEFSDVSPPMTRRTSSVYSRTISQYAPTPESWRSQDLVVSNIFLQPSVYSLSTPELALDRPSDSLLPLPRPCAPLIASPSPSPSRKSTPSPPPGLHGSELLPPPSPMLRLNTHHIRTVSLEKAKAALQSPGTQPLLPEEMRALAAAKKAKEALLRSSKSFEGVFAAKSPVLRLSSSPSPPLAPSADNDWPLHAASLSGKRDSKLTDDCFGISKGIRISLAPVDKQILDPVDVLVKRSADFPTQDFEPRGRVRKKSPSGSSTGTHSEQKASKTSSNGSLMNEAQRLANEYHALFKDQPIGTVDSRKHSASSASVKSAMKLVPQPLFFNPRTVSKQRAQQYQRELSERRVSPSTTSRSPASRPNPRVPKLGPGPKERMAGFPFKLSLTPESTGPRRRRSTSGSIPISPPFASKPEFSPKPTEVHASSTTSTRKQSIDDSNRFSAFYQRINADAQQLARDYKPIGNSKWELDKLALFPSSNTTPPTDSHSPFRKVSHASTTSATSSKATLKKGLGALFNKRKLSITAIDGLSSLVDSFKQRRPSFPVISAPQPISFADAYGDAKMTKDAVKRPSLFAGIREHRRESKATKRREEIKKTIKMIPVAVPGAIFEAKAEGTGANNSGDGMQKGEWV